ncbi:hypothetical protein [Massilia niastensis]|uniref:hypothetical protein n=1 Tax=Massilia niastensis TaxID=544911 RepID=UPI0003666813|nr:hypothetical protein [Massilia niastensis]
MFLQNDVLEYAGPPRRAIRILWIDRAQALAYTYALRQESALPQAQPLQALVNDVQAHRARLLLVDPYAAPRVTHQVPASYLALQAKALDAVQALHAGLPALYRQRERAAMVAAYAASHGIARSSVMRYLRRYWERGQTPQALLPDYGNSGAPGRTRAATAGVKRGRPRKDAQAGTNADAEIRAIFRAAAARYAVTHDGFSRRAAYRQMLEEFFRGREAGAVPSFGQFSYWLERDGASSEQAIAAVHDTA